MIGACCQRSIGFVRKNLRTYLTKPRIRRRLIIDYRLGRLAQARYAPKLGSVISIWLLAVLFACGPDVNVGPTGDSSAARESLADALKNGPVRAQIFGDPFGIDPERQDSLVAGAIGDGVYGIKAQFSADPDRYRGEQPRLVVILNPQSDPPASQACLAPEQIRTASATDELTLLAAFCQNGTVINAARATGPVAGPADQRLKRLLWKTGGVLFPDDYERNYGIDLIPGINIGIGGSFGF